MLHEASLTHMPSQLRDLFVQILVHCLPSDPLQLWTEHREEMASDFVRRGATHARSLDAALQAIDSLLQCHGTTSVACGLPPHEAFNHEEPRNRALRQALAFDEYDAAEIAERMIPQLTPEQQSILEDIKAASEATSPDTQSRAFYVDGPGGSGKTFLYQTLIHHFHSRGQIALACAMSGVAATLLPGGTTAHSLFGLPIHMNDSIVSSSIKVGVI